MRFDGQPPGPLSEYKEFLPPAALADRLLCFWTQTIIGGAGRGVQAGIQWLSRHPHCHIRQLSRWIGISERQLHRGFSAAVGYGPKTFQSVLRFQRLLKTAQEGGGKVVSGEKEKDKKEKPKGRQDAGATKAGEESLAELAASAGYADQAHMTREVRRLADLRSSVLLRSTESTLQMSDLFKT